MSLRTHITRHFRSEDCSIHLPYFSQVPVWPNRARMKKRHGQREDFKQENVRSDAEPFQFKVPHLAFICWIPCLLHVLAAVFTSSRIWRSHVNPKSWSSHWLFLFTPSWGHLWRMHLNTHTNINRHLKSTSTSSIYPSTASSDKWRVTEAPKKRESSEESGVWKEPLIQCPTSVSNTCTVYSLQCFTQCHPQLMALTGRATYPLLGPQTLPGPLWVPNWAYHPLDWINSLVPGTFTPPARGGFIPSVPARWRRGGRSKGSRSAELSKCQQSVALAVGKTKLEMWTGGIQRSRSSQGQACQMDAGS